MNCSRQLDYFFKENSDLPSEVDSVWVAFNSMLINGLNWDPYILVIGSAGKEFTCNAGDLGSIPVLEDPLEKGKATHSSILAWIIRGVCSPWGRKELNTTEQLSLSLQKQ